MSLPSRVIAAAFRSVRTVPRVLLAGLLVLAGAAGATYAATQAPKPAITLQVSPASQSVARGQSTSYTVFVTSSNGFTGTVGLTASGLPTGATAGFAPAWVTLASGATASSTMTVTTTSSTPVGSYTLTITGTSGKVKGTVTAGLTVNYPVSSALAMTATPATVTLGPGSTASYTVQLTRTNLPGPVTFAVYGGLPAGATATFTPNPTTGNTSALEVATSGSTPDGTYTLYLVGSGRDPGGTTRYAYASVQLVVDSSTRPFTISGGLTGLAPGVSRPLDLTLTNPNKKALSVSNLGVTIDHVTRAAGATLPCDPSDYAVVQYTGPYPLTVPANGSASLSGLGVASSAWPRITMLDRPVNQDGCKGATLTLAYTGAGYGS
jgi:hypothetical protein